MVDISVEKSQILELVFQQYDIEQKGELGPVQLQVLHGDMRMGGISMQQVLASIQYVCVGGKCQVTELIDLLQEMDRRFFLLQDLRWEFSMLDREGKNSISVEQARWLVQAVHGKYFSRHKWDHFLKSRAVPGCGVGLVEIEVLLCDIPSKTEAQDEQRQLQQEEEEKLRKKKEFEDAVKVEKEKMKREMENLRKRKQNEVEEERRRRREEEELRIKQEEEEQHRREQEEEEERLRKFREEERKRRADEEEKYRDAERFRDEAAKAEKGAEDRLKKLKQLKTGAAGKKMTELEQEEKTLKDALRHNRHKRIRYQLKVAVKTRDKFQLEFSVDEFKKEELSDDDMDMERAQKLLQQISAQEGLHKALSKREIEQIERAMTYVRKHGFESELANEMMAANKLLGQLRRLEHIRHEILELKQSTVAEIRSYQSPPPIVHSVMTAVLLLLGHPEKETKDWKAVQALVGKTGKENLKRRCLEFKSDSLSVSVGKRTKTLLRNFELDEVRDISAGAATFYVWATTIIEDVMDRE